MTTSVNSVIEKVGITLQDVGAKRWKANELLAWMNDGLRALIVLFPDAKVKTATVTLAIGAKQVTPDDCVSLQGMYDADGNAVLFCLRNYLDSFLPGWRAKPSTGLLNYMYDTADPQVFYVYPAQEAPANADLTYSAYPAAAVAGGNLDVLDRYASRLIDYILYRAYEKDAEFDGAASRSASHYAAFSQ